MGAAIVDKPRLADFSAILRLHALDPGFDPEIPKGSVLGDRSLPVEERIQRAQAELVERLRLLKVETPSEIARNGAEYARLGQLLMKLYALGAKEWVEAKFSPEMNILARCGVELPQYGIVAFTLPEGMSYLELFEEANRYCRNQSAAGLVPPVGKAALQWLRRHTDAAMHAAKDERHTIRILVPGSRMKSRGQQSALLEKKGLTWPSLEETAAAIVLHYCLTGKEGFPGPWLRTAARGLGVGFWREGLAIKKGLTDELDTSADIGCSGARTL